MADTPRCPNPDNAHQPSTSQLQHPALRHLQLSMILLDQPRHCRHQPPQPHPRIEDTFTLRPANSTTSHTASSSLGWLSFRSWVSVPVDAVMLTVLGLYCDHGVEEAGGATSQALSRAHHRSGSRGVGSHRRLRSSTSPAGPPNKCADPVALGAWLLRRAGRATTRTLRSVDGPAELTSDQDRCYWASAESQPRWRLQLALRAPADEWHARLAAGCDAARRRMSNAAGPLTSDGTPAAYSPARTDHAAHTAAFPKIIQYVVAESPSSWSLRKVRTACGIVSKQERKAPVQASIVTITGATSLRTYGPLVGGCDCSPSR